MSENEEEQENGAGGVRLNERLGEEAEFEVRCDGEPVAWASGCRADAMREAQHYAHVYAMDGAVEVFEVHKTYTKVDA